MNFIKHVGRHSNEKCIVLYRKVPQAENAGVKVFEDHMCYIVYTNKLPRPYHDSIMKALESPEGQNAAEFSDVLFRNLFPDGRNILQTLFKENHVRKVQTIQVIMTLNVHNNIRLDKLNEMLDKISEGGDAAKTLAEMDAKLGLNSGNNKANAQKKVVERFTPPVIAATETGVLTDANIADGLRGQSAALEAQAKSLLAEAARLVSEAEQLAPTPKRAAKATSTAKSAAKKTASKKDAHKQKPTAKQATA